jgi:ComEC/Rec2-related protein
MSRISRAVLHGANLCLFLLFLVAIANAWVVTNTPDLETKLTNTRSQIQTNTDINAKTQTIRARIVWESIDYFGQRQYFLWYDYGIWSIQTAKYLPIGNELIFNGQTQKYSMPTVENQNRYELSLGIQGEFKSFSEIRILSCDFSCSLIQTNINIRNYISSRYKLELCGNIDIYKKIYTKILCRDLAALAQGLVLGGTEGMSENTKTNLRKLGLSHLVAVSGFQVVLLASFAENLLLKLKLPRMLRTFACAMALVGMVCLVGPQPPVLRSSIGVLLSLLVPLVFGRRIESFRLLVYSGLIMLLFNSGYLYSISFHLSFLASLGLVLSQKAESWEWDGYLQGFTGLVNATLSTFLFTLPVVVHLSSNINPMSLLVNLIVVPVIPLLTLLEIMGLVPVLGEFCLFISGVMKTMGLFLMDEMSGIPSQIQLRPLSIIETCAYYLVLIFVYLIIKNYPKFNRARFNDL